MKIPRVIEIPQGIRGIIAVLYQRGQWSDERIAQFTAETLIEIQKQIEGVNAQIHSVIKPHIPADVESFMFDQRSHAIIELLPNDQEGRRWSMPIELKDQLSYLSSEADVRREAAKLTGLPAVAIAERTQAVMGEINKIIYDNLPQCAHGDWRMDLRAMTMTEVLPEPQSKQEP